MGEPRNHFLNQINKEFTCGKVSSFEKFRDSFLLGLMLGTTVIQVTQLKYGIRNYRVSDERGQVVVCLILKTQGAVMIILNSGAGLAARMT